MTLHLGMFNFRNDDVVLLAGDPGAIAALGTHLQQNFDAGRSCVAIHTLAQVSARFPVRLFAVRGATASMEPDALVWPCLDADILKLVDGDTSHLYFDLASAPPFFLVTSSDHYDAAWWATYG